MTSTFIDYVKINENSTKIKSAKIYKSSTIIFSKDGEDTVNISFYDNNGLLKKEQNKFVLKTGSENKQTIQKTYFIYDEFRNIAQKLDSVNNTYKKIIISYEDDGSISREEIYDSKDNKLKVISHEYDNLLRLIESTEKDIDASCKTTKKYAYDSYNNMASYKLTSTCKDSMYKSLNITFIYKYDNKNNVIEKNTLYSDKNFKTEFFKYGSNGKCSQTNILVGQDKYTVILHYYDKTNFLVKQERSEVNGEEKKNFIKTFTNDQYGNLLEIKETNEKGEHTLIIKYVYEYY